MYHWISAPVLLPAIMGAAMVLLMRNDLLLQRIFALVSALGLLAVSVALLIAASNEGPEVYKLGDWPAPFGIVLVLDRLSALMVTLTAALSVSVLLYTIGSGWDARGRHFHALFQFQLMGICGAFLTGDAFNLFVFFEVLLIASYGLMIHSGGRDRLRAGVQYIAFNLVGSSLFLFALGAIYSITGTLNIADLAVKSAELTEGDAALFRVAAVMMMMVFAIKGALVPLQFWLPGTYSNAPGPVAALFAVMTKIGAYSIIRFGVIVLPPTHPITGTLIVDLILPAALITLILGALGILGATSLSRLAAFAAVASMGTAFIAVSGFTPESTAAAIYYMLHSTLAGAALFLISDLVSNRRAHDGLHQALPPIAQAGLISGLFMVSAIATAGMPPLSGFIGKLLVLDALRDQAALVWSVILVTSLMIILGFARAGSTLFWKAHASAPEGEAPSHPAQALAFVGLGSLIAGLVVMTLLAGPIIGWIEVTAESLFDPAAYIAANQLPEGN
ncbi:monovalent cation/H+ antiporter subunit D [Pseudorhodobacter sp. MZDSW-24AT]|uniref:monovalent cation/H+ antiporter subunit D n=1 Tax=Pseudorhodobacter sp. MZDSW-24AT TaxID=2052957 RepID=UPI000C1F14E5|nr:monovalent cation/H+ antiporter subunit D [Pseudorhodobacter sp. MZDSW-24AT]PJF08354.1 monovalent cation/H+ antiporter subunit D [Pseudorhodobacter sp. MZDSW-24AT]